jgi:OOP family OmpA-OmpF porin
MKKLIPIIVFFSIIALASSGFGQVRPGAYSISPFVGNYAFEGNQDLDSKPFYGLRVGYDFTKHLGAELVFGHIPTKYKTATTKIDTDVFNYRLEGLYYITPENKLVPFLSVGAGAQSVNYESGPQSKTRFAADYGYGIKYFVTDWFAFRFDIRHVLAFDSVYNNMEIAAGLSILFGGEKPAPAAVVTEPETAAMVKEPEAAPVIEVKETPPPPVKEPEPVPVPPPPMEEVKKAPEAATEVEQQIVEKGRATLNVQFDTGKAIVKPEYNKEIQKIADVMKKYPKLKIVVEGHTDNVGGKKYNLRLSQKRADAIKKVMVKKFKIKSSRITAKGFGLSKPIASNSTKEGRQKNRRVEAAVEYIIKK